MIRAGLDQHEHAFRRIQTVVRRVDRELDKRNFRKKILSMDLLVETDQVEQGVRHRAARLYRFDKKKYEKLTRQGFSFAI